MLHLDSHITITPSVARDPNLADRFDEDDLRRIGDHVWNGYDRDYSSTIRWRTRSQAAMDLALQMSEAKNFPWPNCSNVAFPLVTIAALQFHSRSYAAVISGTEVVKYRVVGNDPTGYENARALRIGRHMSYQRLEEDQSWEEQHDRTLINIPIVGCAFKKTYYSPRKGHSVSDLVLAQDLVLDYYAKSVEECARKTHRYPMHRNEIYENVYSGIFCNVLEESWYLASAYVNTNSFDSGQDNRTGKSPQTSDQDTPFIILEQHCWLDLDGDGYQEPYIVSIEETSRKVLRIAARWDREEDVERVGGNRILRIHPREYFTKYGFIPSPDGSVYDVGFGVLLGPLNEAVNSLVNQLVDAGTMQNTAGGFLARGAKIRGGVYTFSPLEWKRVDSTGDDLRKSVFPLPVREPSTVLFQLLSLLINYTQRISGTTDTMAGENPGQNTPAQTTQTMVEQGTKIYNALFKRVYRSMKAEFKKLYILNAIYMPVRQLYGEEGNAALREDYLGDPDRIAPVADPTVISEHTSFLRAQAVKQSAMVTPGYDLGAVERKYLKALHVDDWETLYPGRDKVPPLPNPKVQVEQMKAELGKAKLQLEQQQFVMELMEQQRLNSATILKLEADAQKSLAESDGVQAGTKIAAFEAHLGALKAHDEALRARIELMMKSKEGLDGGRGMEGMEVAPSNPGSSKASLPMGAGV